MAFIKQDTLTTTLDNHFLIFSSIPKIRHFHISKKTDNKLNLQKTFDITSRNQISEQKSISLFLDSYGNEITFRCQAFSRMISDAILMMGFSIFYKNVNAMYVKTNSTTSKDEKRSYEEVQESEVDGILT